MTQINLMKIRPDEEDIRRIIREELIEDKERKFVKLLAKELERLIKNEK